MTKWVLDQIAVDDIICKLDEASALHTGASNSPDGQIWKKRQTAENFAWIFAYPVRLIDLLSYVFK